MGMQQATKSACFNYEMGIFSRRYRLGETGKMVNAFFCPNVACLPIAIVSPDKFKPKSYCNGAVSLYRPSGNAFSIRNADFQWLRCELSNAALGRYGGRQPST